MFHLASDCCIFSIVGSFMFAVDRTRSSVIGKSVGVCAKTLFDVLIRGLGEVGSAGEENLPQLCEKLAGPIVLQKARQLKLHGVRWADFWEGGPG